MPELPEVQTTVNGLNKEVKELKIVDVWTDYNSVFHAGKNNIKNPEYFKQFKKDVVGTKILNASRKGKNVLIHLSNGNTVLTHMKMTGHYLYGRYSVVPEALRATFAKQNEAHKAQGRFIHLIFSLSNKKHLAFSDMRKFAKVFVFKTKEENAVLDLMHLGPDALSKDFTFSIFKQQLLKKPQ